jgi:drug/metabolite transporter (DMT)-like permease
VPAQEPSGTRRRSTRLTARGALVSLHVAVALFGFAALFGKWIALPATAIVLGRTVIAAATLAIVVAGSKQRLGWPGRAAAVNGAILALHWVTFFAAVQVAGVAVGLLGYASFPLFVLLLERRLLPGRAIPIEWATAILAAAGLIVLVPAFSWSSDASRGLALGVVSGFTFAWLSVRNRRLVLDMTPARIALWQNVFAAACLVPIVALLDPLPRSPTPAEVGLLLVLGVICTGLAHTLFIASMQRVSAHAASVVAALEPVYGIALAALLLHEIPTIRTWVGGALIVSAALAASHRTRTDA